MLLPPAPAVQTNTQKKVMQLFPGNALGQLVNAITDAIYTSFLTPDLKMLNATMEEKRRRFAICMDWAQVLRGDLKWGMQRICDAIPEILNTELSGKKWTPSDRRCWISSDGG